MPYKYCQEVTSQLEDNLIILPQDGLHHYWKPTRRTYNGRKRLFKGSFKKIIADDIRSPFLSRLSLFSAILTFLKW